MAIPDPIIYNPDIHQHFLPTTAAIHADCITLDGTLATFLPPLSHTKILAFWQDHDRQVSAGSMAIFMQFAPGPGGDEELAGYVALRLPWSETGPFRSTAVKLMTLDTMLGSPAENVYARLGYKVIGVIPEYGVDPKTGALVDEIFYYKDLRSNSRAGRPVNRSIFRPLSK